MYINKIYIYIIWKRKNEGIRYGKMSFLSKVFLTKFNSLHRKPKIIKATKENTSSIIIQSIKTKTSKPQGIVYGSDT